MPRFALIAAAAVATAMSFSPALAQENGEAHAHDVTDIWDIARGGQLYDKWWAVIEADAPEATHPAYPADGKKSGSSTWRCKECHGWDYRGKDGTYAKGSHFTGIIGVRGVEGMSADQLHDIIMNETHGYTEQQMPHSAMEKLALFLSRGQVDTERYIDRETKMARGNPRRGAALFQTICAVCHGFDGKEINFHDADDPEYVGTVAVKNPWEALHKIRFGQPGVGMIALGALDIDELIDIVAYTQQLPTE